MWKEKSWARWKLQIQYFPKHKSIFSSISRRRAPRFEKGNFSIEQTNLKENLLLWLLFNHRNKQELKWIRLKEHIQKLKRRGGKKGKSFLPFWRWGNFFFPLHFSESFRKFFVSMAKDEGFHPLVLLARAVNLKSNYQTYMLKHSPKKPRTKTFLRKFILLNHIHKIFPSLSPLHSTDIFPSTNSIWKAEIFL